MSRENRIKRERKEFGEKVKGREEKEKEKRERERRKENCIGTNRVQNVFKM